MATTLHPREQVALIPNVAHFIWYGRTLPWLHAMSIVSAARAGGFEQVVLHHEPGLSSELLKRLSALPRFEARVIDPERMFRGHGRRAELHALYARLVQPAARANLMRAAILNAEGGVYIDMDVVTLKSFEPLRHTGMFCGAEPVAFPGSLVEQPTLSGYARAHAINLFRELLRLSPRGPHWFSRYAHWFSLAPNNAIVGAQAGHPALVRLLDNMLDLPADRQLRRYALGTHLLQRIVRTDDSQTLTVHPQAAFYPLGPQLSEHWFRIQRLTRVRVRLTDVIAPDTYAVHWYASVRTHRWVTRMDAEFVRSHHGDQLLSELLAAHVDALPSYRD